MARGLAQIVESSEQFVPVPFSRTVFSQAVRCTREGPMVSDPFLSNLRCPDDRSELALAAAELIDRVNARIAAGRAINRGGRVLGQPIDDGLVRAAGDVLYPIVDGIPRLLVEEGILLGELEIVLDG